MIKQKIDITDRIEKMFNLYLKHNRKWKFPLVSVQSFIFLNQCLKFYFLSPKLFDAILKVNEEVLEWAESYRPVDEFYHSLRHEQKIVEKSFHQIPIWAKLVSGVISPIDGKPYLIFPFYKFEKRIQMATKLYQDCAGHGWKKVESKTQVYLAKSE